MNWEYKVVEIAGRPENAVGELNPLGSEGWEAVSVWTDAICTHILLKRIRK